MKFGEVALKYGGTISAEHGIGRHKKEMLKMALEARGSPATLRIYREVKHIFDSYGIFNPGKIFD
jgi:FAD/FMN-containing dehydrogenases